MLGVRPKKIFEVIANLLLFTIILFGLALCFVNYVASFALFVGVFLASRNITYSITKNLFGYLLAAIKKQPKPLILIYIIYLVVFIIYSIDLIIHWFFLIPVPPITQSFNPPYFNTYNLMIKPLDYNLSQFKINEHLTKNKGNKSKYNKENNQTNNIKITSLNEKVVIARNKGIILKELFVRPFDVNVNGVVTLNLSNGKSWQGNLCKDFCPISTVKLVDFPKKSLFKNIQLNIKNDKELTIVDEYLDTVVLRWSASNIENGIMIAYIKPPFHRLKRYIQPFLKIAEANYLLIFFLGGTYITIIKLLKERKPILKSSKVNMIFNAPVTGVAGNIEGSQNIFTSQSITQASTEIQNLLTTLQNNGLTQEQAEGIVANNLATQAKINQTFKDRLMNWGKSLGNKAAEASVNEVTRRVIRLALNLAGVPMP